MGGVAGAVPKYAAGGGIGVVPMSEQDSSPFLGGYLQQMAQMSPEELQRFAVQTGGNATPTGQLVDATLAQKHILGATQSPGYTGSAGGIAPLPQVSAPIQQAEQQNLAGAKKGGTIHREKGGIIPYELADPWANRMSAPSGLISSSIAGRTDRIPVTPAADSFVVPADVVSGLGEGNTLSGAHVLDVMLHVGPYGTTLPHLPVEGHPVHAVGLPAMGWHPEQYQSKGGVAGGHDPHEPVPIIAAGGEYIVPPAAMARLGKGDINHGHEIMRELVKQVREDVIKTLKKLPGPVK